MAQTQDKSILTVQQIGKRQSFTPEGFLLCEEVPIARTGEMYYADGEVPVDAGPDGIIRITRGPDELFHPDALASFNGKPVTNDHPPEGVTPDNWKSVTIGIVQNTRQGAGIDNDLMIADLLITDAEGIKAVRSGKREVSNGYDAEYEQIEAGRGQQRRIIGNHVAIVERGRCGTRCAIGDSEMAKPSGLVAKLLAAFRTKDEAAFRKTLDEAGMAEEEEKKTDDEEEGEGAGKKADKTADTLGKILDKLTTMDSRLSALEKTKDEEGHKEPDGDEGKTKDGEEEEETKDEDEAGEPDKKATADSLKEVLSRAEILAPGVKISVPTTDSLKTRKQAKDAICACKRQALSAALKTTDGEKAVKPFLGGKTVDAAPCATIDAAFVGASELLTQVRSVKASAVIHSVRTSDTADAQKGRVMDADTLNKKHREFWEKNGGASRF